MPIYEYVCAKCTKSFEILKTSSNDNETITCPECKSLEVKKTISSGSFRMNSAGASAPCGPPSGCPSNAGFS
ncbi:MAG: zinc ribbon domain-containing protein [Candidatus Electrothrix sp. AW5]|nr:zinc ribbon domain-containing protein [Candidatus Electrothrix gigas]